MKLIAAILLSLSYPVFAQTPAPAPAPAPTPAKGPTLKAQLSKTPLASITLPQVTFDQASVDDAIAALTTMVDTATKGAVKLQWIDRGYDRKKWPKTVTVSVTGFSAGRLMTEILEQAGLEAKLEDHVILLRPKPQMIERQVVVPGEKSEGGKVESGPAYDTLRKNPVVK
jgi:hypothetical protein